MADIRFERATRIYPGTDAPAVDALDLHIADGELMVLVGPSGSGKSTALRMLAGLEDVDDGGIWIGDRDVTYVRPRDRDVAMVFQNYALYPYLTVAQNIAFPLKMARRLKRSERDLRVREVADLLGLDRPPRAQAGSALGRPAPARGDGPRDRALADGVPHGRAALEPGREAPRPDARRHRRSPGAARCDDRLRHARPVRGDDARQPRRGAPRRSPAAMRAAARALRPPGERIRRRLHRLARDEPDRGRLSGRTARSTSAASGCRFPRGRPPPRRRAGSPGSSSGSVPSRSGSRATASPRGSRQSRCSAPTPTSSARRTIGGAETRITARADARVAPERGEAVRLAAESRDAHLFDPGSGERLPA